MNFSSQILELLATWLIVLLVPGQDFALIFKTTLNESARKAMHVVTGICTALSIQVAVAGTGVGALLTARPSLISTMKILAAAYLFYLGTTSLVAAFKQHRTDSELRIARVALGTWKAFLIGFTSTILNVKVLIFFVVLFSGIVSPDRTPFELFEAGLAIVALTGLYYFILTRALSSKMVRQFFEDKGHRVEFISGIALVLLAIKIAVN